MRAPRASAALRLSTLVLSACVMRTPLPATPPLGPDAGIAPSDFDRGLACNAWRWATANPEARKHESFPEFSPLGCFSTVDYAMAPERIVSASDLQASCAFTPSRERALLSARAERYDAIARGERTEVPLELACALSPERRRAAARQNARTLRALAQDGGAYAYGAGITFGYGNDEQNASGLAPWLPGDRCDTLTERRRAMLSVNVQRADRAAETYRSGLAPVIIVSGGAVHADVVEAFMLTFLASCEGGVPIDRVLVDPCADHTHTNVRNSGALLRHLGARTGYVVTDDYIQADYLQEFSGFELLGGSIDDRALRDFGFLLGSWRQASRGMDSGFWFTPFRFWGDPDPEMRAFACAGDVGELVE